MGTRLFVAIFFLIIIAGTITYLLIPSPLVASGQIILNTSSNGAYRVLTNDSTWNKWAPGNFNISKKLISSIELKVKNRSSSVPVSILLIPKSPDSVIVSWNAVLPVVKNPFTKIRQYGQASATKDKVDNALRNFQSYVEHNENVYGIPIKEISTTDTFLVATKFTSDSFPSNQLIYSYIEKLQSFAAASGANQISPPMLNVSMIDSTTYSCMTALPIDKMVQSNGPIFFVRMVPGRFLTSEIKGGPYTIHDAQKTLSQYIADFNRLAMALPFEYLITNRLHESDTAKWITKIYTPVAPIY